MKIDKLPINQKYKHMKTCLFILSNFPKRVNAKTAQ